jgi:predicted NAD-dependent protein-ADP-ribosyltransferase YbiA (DUF1768 family)
MVAPVTSKRARRARQLEVWAESVEQEDLVEIDGDQLKTIAHYAQRREFIDNALTEAVRAARRSGRSWSQIGAMLGVSKQAAQRKYAKVVGR